MEGKIEKISATVKDVDDLLESGASLREALDIIEEEKEVSSHTVKDWYYKCGGNPSRSHGNQLLTKDQSKLLESIVISFSACSVPLEPFRILEIVETLFHVHPSKSWASKWMKKRMHLLSMRTSKTLAISRKVGVTIEDVERFCDLLERSQEYHHYAERQVINYDETRICIGSTPHLVVEWSGKTGSDTLGEKLQTVATLLTFITAAGEVLLSVYILKAHETKSDGQLSGWIPTESRPSRGRHNWERLFAFTESGCINKELFSSILKHVVDLWSTLHPGLEAYLFGDELNAHVNLELMKYCYERKVHMWFFPAHCSHFLQPADDLVFVIFKKLVETNITRIISDGYFSAIEVPESFFHMIYEAERRAFLPGIIKKSFKRTGLFPYSREKILNNASTHLNGDVARIIDEEHRVAVEAMTEVIERRLLDSTKHSQTNKKRENIIMKNSLYDPEMHIAYKENKITEKEEKKKGTRRYKEKKRGGAYLTRGSSTALKMFIGNL